MELSLTQWLAVAGAVLFVLDYFGIAQAINESLREGEGWITFIVTVTVAFFPAIVVYWIVLAVLLGPVGMTMIVIHIVWLALYGIAFVIAKMSLLPKGVFGILGIALTATSLAVEFNVFKGIA